MMNRLVCMAMAQSSQMDNVSMEPTYFYLIDQLQRTKRWSRGMTYQPYIFESPKLKHGVGHVLTVIGE